MPISNVQTDGSRIKVYDQNSKRISQKSSRKFEVDGTASDFFVTLESSWINTYDEQCNRISQRAN